MNFWKRFVAEFEAEEQLHSLFEWLLGVALYSFVFGALPMKMFGFDAGYQAMLGIVALPLAFGLVLLFYFALDILER